MYQHIILLIIGISILYFGGELFIRGSSRAAKLFGIRPLIVGVVIVAFATSAPEFFVSVFAVINKSRNLAVGNIIGSCICNIGMALGIAALIRPIKVDASILKRELPILLTATLALFVICLDFKITRVEAVLLILAFFIFIFYCIRSAKTDDGSYLDTSTSSISKLRSFIYLGLGLLGLVVGARFMVQSSISIAKIIGISELVIGLSVVAIGTSLPELAASAIASSKNQGDISIGNVIGSNLFNMLAIIGVVALIRPVIIDPKILMLSLPVLLIYTFVLLPIIKKGFKINRITGAFFVLSYFIYLYLIFKK